MPLTSPTDGDVEGQSMDEDLATASVDLFWLPLGAGGKRRALERQAVRVVGGPS